MSSPSRQSAVRRAFYAFAGAALSLHSLPSQAGETLPQVLADIHATPMQREIVAQLPYPIAIISSDTPKAGMPEDAQAKMMLPSAFNDFSLTDKKSGVCRIFSVTRPQKLLPYFQSWVNQNFEDAGIFSEDETAQFVFFHETGHCRQNTQGRTEMDVESEADLHGIRMVLKANPGSNIAQMVLTLRTLVPYPYKNALALSYKLRGEDMPPAVKMAAAMDKAAHDIRRAGDRIAPAMARRFGQDRAGFATALGAAMRVASQADDALVREAAQLRVDALRFMRPKLAAATERFMNQIPTYVAAANWRP